MPSYIHSCIHSYIHPCNHLIHPSIAYAFIHSLLYSFIHSSHTSKHCICNYCIIMLRIASRSGSHLIRHERRPTRVRRLAREGLEAASCQTEPGEKNLDEPQRPCPTTLRSGQGHLDLSRSILTSSQAHRISIEGSPAGHLSHFPE